MRDADMTPEATKGGPSCGAAWLVDTHCHLDHHKTPGTPAEIVQRADAAGVGQLVNVESGATLEANETTIATAEAFPHVYAAIGIHPHDAGEVTDAIVEGIRALSTRDKVVAIGEAGLDYHYDRHPRELQRDAFARWIALARDVDLPLVVHTRDAEDDTLDVLRAERLGPAGGVIHCFTGTLDFARKAVDLGFFVSIPGVVTFRNAGEIPETAKWLPADRILVETDSPYLAPIPRRGRPNEPAYVAHTAAFVAGLRGVSLEDLARTTTANAQRLFRLPARAQRAA